MSYFSKKHVPFTGSAGLMQAAFILPVLAVGLLLGGSAHAQTVAQPTSVLATGGGTSSGTNHSLQGTLGQPVIGQATGANHTHGAGFWYQVLGLPDTSSPVVTRYVAPTGSDAGNDCSNPASPCATITHAVSQANDGDTINVAAGTYTEPGLLIEKNLLIQGQGVIVQ